LQSYLNEYAFRYNHRRDGGMFDALLARAVGRQELPRPTSGPPAPVNHHGC
jgi:hypothetical protein